MNARHVKQVPGRETNVSDAAWLCELLEAWVLRANLVPPKPIRALRQLTRYRKTQIKERQREVNRLHKALEDTGVKLDRVASNMLGVSRPRNARRAGLGHDRTRRCSHPRDQLRSELARGKQKIPALTERSMSCMRC